jgi:hypothetical protein
MDEVRMYRCSLADSFFVTSSRLPIHDSPQLIEINKKMKIGSSTCPYQHLFLTEKKQQLWQFAVSSLG